MSYFAKTNFILYEELINDNLEKNKIDIKNKKINPNSKIHKFFYEQSNYKVGASENNLQINIKVNEKEMLTNNYLEKHSGILASKSNMKFRFLKKFPQRKLKFNFTKKLIYSLSIFGFVFIFGFLLFFISQSNKNDSRIRNKSFVLGKNYSFLKELINFFFYRFIF